MAWWNRRRGDSAPDAEIVMLKNQVAALQESLLDAPYDVDAGLSATGGGSAYFRRLSNQNDRDFNPLQQEQALKTVRYLVESNPLARRVTQVVRDFVIGDGVTVAAQDDDPGVKDAMQAVIDQFWTHPYNNMDLWVHDLTLELGIDGELCLTAKANPKDGSVLLGYINPAEIVEVYLNPIDQRTPEVVAVRKSGAPSECDYFRVIHMDIDPTSDTFGRLIGAGEGETASIKGESVPFMGSVFFFRVNAPTGARRGRSDLLSVADWVDAYDQHLFGEVERSALMKAFTWDVTFEGNDTIALNEYKKNNPAPKPGSVRYHNEKVKWEAVTPDLKSVDAQNLADLLLSNVATGTGTTKVWLNGLMDANLATAKEAGEAPIKMLTARQRYVRYLLATIINYVLDQAELAKRLPVSRQQPGSVWPKPWKFAVQMPEIRSRDLKAAGDTLSATVQALTVAKTDYAIDLETYQEIVVMLAAQMGIDVDLEQMRDRIEKARTADEEAAALAPYPNPQQPNMDPNGDAEDAAMTKQEQPA